MLRCRPFLHAECKLPHVQASPTTSWFLMTIPERVTGRGVTSTWAKNNRFWNTEIALLNDKLRNSTALQPRGSVWLLDAHDISKGEYGINKDCLLLQLATIEMVALQIAWHGAVRMATMSTSSSTNYFSDNVEPYQAQLVIICTICERRVLGAKYP